MTDALVKIADARTVPLLAEMARNVSDTHGRDARYDFDAAVELLAGLGEEGVTELISLFKLSPTRVSNVVLIDAGEPVVGPMTAFL